MESEMVLEMVLEREKAQQRWTYSPVFVLLLIYHQHLNIL